MCSTPRLRTCCGGARGSPRSRTTRRCTSRISRRPSRRSWTSSPLRRTESRWRSEVRDGPPRHEVGRMTHQNVEVLIGKLVTDEELREAFQQNPRAVLTWLRHQGLQLSSLEMEALTSISPSELNALADRFDGRLQKASLRRSHMTRTGQDTETLPTTLLGTTDMRITRVGFGAWAIGGGGWAFSWGRQDDAASLATMRHALELGINWIDTAAVYGLGHSEEVVGRLLRELSPAARPLVFTKCGLVWDAHDRMAEPRRVLKPESIRAECDASLRRLGVERIDLYQFHWPDETGTPVEDSWGEMVRLIEKGKVRAAGVSNFNVKLIERCETIRHVDSLQPPFSLIRREAAAHEIPWCAEHRTGVICYSPMQSGLLTDGFTAARLNAL